MDEQQKKDLLDSGHSRYEVAPYVRGEKPGLDAALSRLPNMFEMEGSMRELTAGGRGLTCWIALEGDSLAVYLPPEDPEWGSKSQIITPGYRPSQEGAECEFHRWLEQFSKHGD